MTIYVDELVNWGGSKTFRSKRSCHLSTDDHSPAGIEALHCFAEQIGLARWMFQDHPLMPHYDLFPSKYALAVARGAIVVRPLEMSRLCGTRRMKDAVLGDEDDEDKDVAPEGKQHPLCDTGSLW